MKDELWLIWKYPKLNKTYKIGILNYDDDIYTFKYVNPELNSAREVGFRSFPGFDDINKTYESDELFANIETRLPNKSRPDYLEILNSYNLKNDSTKFDILKATKGRLITDNYEFVSAFDSLRIEFDVAGTRYCSDVVECKKIISINDKLLLKHDIDNKHDENAIKVILRKNGKNYHLGYVPRYYAKELSSCLRKNILYSAMVEGLSFESEFSDEDITVLVKLIFNN